MIHTMQVGEQRRYKRVITKDEVALFGEITKDTNKAHFDESYCAETHFKKPIVHGMFIGSLFSKIFGLEYPGEGTIYCSQTLKFLKPVYPDTLLDVVVTVTEVILERNRVIFLTEVYNEHGECVVTGEAMLMPKKEKKHE